MENRSKIINQEGGNMKEILEKLDRAVEIEILKFAWQRYGNKKGWQERMWALSPKGICKIYFREFVNWEDEKKKMKTLKSSGEENNKIKMGTVRERSRMFLLAFRRAVPIFMEGKDGKK